MLNPIPEQLSSMSHFIKLYPEEKQPVGSTTKGPFFEYSSPELNDWINDGGNVGLSLNNHIVVFDIDSSKLRDILDDYLPHSFTTLTGSGGYHRFFSCPDWTDLRQFKADGRDLGSLRSDSWQVVIPPSTHPNGTRYRVRSAVDIANISVDDINQVISQIPNQDTANTGSSGSGSSAAAGVGYSPIPQVPEIYPSYDTDKNQTRKYLKQAGFLDDLDQTKVSDDWSGLEFKLAKCLSDRGCSEESIKSTLDDLDHNSKWHNRNDDDSVYQQRTVRNAIKRSCDEIDKPNCYVPFIVDMEPSEGSERRKTDSGNKGSRKKGGENTMSTFENKESVQVKSGDNDGDKVIKARLVEGNDEGDTFEFVSLLEGQVQQVELTNGESATMLDMDEDYEATSVGGVDNLDLVIESLEKLQDEIQ
jgi:hypothetical protein